MADNQAATNEVQTDSRVVYVGTGRRPRFKISFLVSYQDERTWRQRLAIEMEDVCREMTEQGLHLTHVDEEGLASTLEEAGFVDVDVVTERLEIDLPSMAEFFPKMIANTQCWPTFEALSNGEKKAVIEHMNGSVSERPGGMIAQMTAVVAGGTTG